MSYLVTGGAGFIGAHVVAQLSRAGHQVTSYDLHLDSAFLKQVAPTGVTYVQGDILDLSRLLAAAQQSNVHTLIHLASPLSTVTEDNPWLAVNTMCLGHINILETAKQLGLRKVVWASSVAVFGPPDCYPKGQVDDDSPHYPATLYGACKSLNERLGRHYRERFGLESVGLRYPVVYGPGRVRGAALFVKDLVEKAVLGKACVLPYADDPLNWLYVKDAAKATIACAETRTFLPAAVNVSGEIATVREAAAVVSQLVPSAIFEFEGGSFGVPAEIEAAALGEALGFRPDYSLWQGLEETVHWARRELSKPEGS